MRNNNKRVVNRRKPLYDRGEEILRSRSVLVTVAKDVRRLFHELKIHRVELKLYEDLHKAQIELAALRDRYTDLYESYPSALLTLDKDGRILESNLMAAKMLGVELKDLLGTNLARFLTIESLGNWYRHCPAGSSTEEKQVCDIRMRRADNSLLYIRAESIGVGCGSEGHWRTALFDVSQQSENSLATRDELAAINCRLRKAA